MTVMGRDYSKVVTWSPTDKGSAVTLSGENLTGTSTAGYTNGGARANKGVSSGKWYWEITMKFITINPNNSLMIGVANASALLTTTDWNNTRMYYSGGTKYPGGIAYGGTFASNNIIGVALDMDVGTITFYKNGVSQGIAFSDVLTLGSIVYPYFSSGLSTGTDAAIANFGATPFTYSVPSGYSALDPNITIQISSGNVVSSLTNMQVGDCIPCRYIATSGVAGTFSELGTCVASEIPVTGVVAPDGLFNFVKVSKGCCIADRVIQTGISWDVLNTAKFIEGISSSLVPLMTTNTLPYGIASANQIYNLSYDAYRLFDGVDATDYASSASATFPVLVGYEFTLNTLVTSYSIRASSASGTPNEPLICS